MNDKLELLQNKARQKGFDINPPEETIEEKIDASMEEFSRQIASAQAIIKFIDFKNDELLQAKQEVENATSNEQQTEISTRINKISNDITSRQTEMKTLIEALDKMVTDTKETETDKNSTDIRIKQNLFGSTTKRYQKVCLRFQTLESEIKTIMQTKIIRSAEIALGRKLEDNERIEVLNEPSTVQTLYENKLKGTAHVKLQNAVSDLEDRHRDIKNLERSILAVHNLVIELSKLVQLQGEMIDNIETNIKSAKNYVQSAEKNIVQAKKNMQSARKKKCIILIIVVIIVAIAVIIPVALH